MNQSISYRVPRCISVCLTIALAAVVGSPFVNASPCVVPEAGGTASLPPVACVYTTPDVLGVNDLFIIDGLPAGTNIQMDSNLHTFTSIAHAPGGSLGGEIQNYEAQLDMPMIGHGTLAGFNRNIVLPLTFVESHSASRVPHNSPQSFATVMYGLNGQITGDPDFDLLRITAGSGFGFGLPSPGHTTLTRLGPPGSNWNVDSFFDITYRIDFIGAPGSLLAGMSGSTTATARFVVGNGQIPEPSSCLMLLSSMAGIVCTATRRARGR